MYGWSPGSATTPPRLRRTAARCALHSRGEVADHGVEPDVDALGLFGIALDRNRDTPVDVARHRTGLHVVDEREREVADVGAPARLPLDPRAEPFGECGQVEEEMRRLSELGRH